jgi:hypothetical protein
MDADWTVIATADPRIKTSDQETKEYNTIFIDDLHLMNIGPIEAAYLLDKEDIKVGFICIEHEPGKIKSSTKFVSEGQCMSSQDIYEEFLAKVDEIDIRDTGCFVIDSCEYIDTLLPVEAQEERLPEYCYLEKQNKPEKKMEYKGVPFVNKMFRRKMMHHKSGCRGVALSKRMDRR